MAMPSTGEVYLTLPFTLPPPAQVAKLILTIHSLTTTMLEPGPCLGCGDASKPLLPANQKREEGDQISGAAEGRAGCDRVLCGGVEESQERWSRVMAGV